jgi:NAD(P)-dependent dehydrogenase (short-subunit alcohol dehydrogenase family)
VTRVIVTGAAGAIGFRTLTTLHDLDCDVVGLDLRADRQHGIRGGCDVTDPESARAGIEAAIGELGGLDVLINNAGVGGPASAGAAPGPEARKIVEVNLFGAWNVTAAAIDALVESRGRVVFVASRMAFLGLPLGAAYAVSKRGLTAYADCVRAEFGTHVRVASVHPAMVRTPIHDTTKAAGLSLDGVSTEEDIDDVVARIVSASLDARPKRDAAVSRAGKVQLWVARHAPRLVDRVVARQVRGRVAAGAFDSAALADGLRHRHGRE